MQTELQEVHTLREELALALVVYILTIEVELISTHILLGIDQTLVQVV